jgi:Ca2+-transporting ATPase
MEGGLDMIAASDHSARAADLSALTAPEARVVRDGRQQAIASAEVVVGDVLVLGEGEIVAADALVLESAALLVDESALNGESVPVDKVAAPAGQAPSPPETTLSAGTVIVRGRGSALVTAIGADSAMGRIAALMSIGPTFTPLPPAR